jgi:hypothetical protein
MKFEKATPVLLKTHPELNEKWLQQRLAEDPALLGLGDLEVKEAERPQPRAGRLDMLLTDPETRTRYEVEVQLGATDETHIIRTIEYWDIEKGRYPQYDHVAVLVAEDITSRFLNVIALFNRAIPLIAIQMSALQVGEILTLQATTVLNRASLGTDEEDEPGQATDRDYWIRRGSKKSVAAADELLKLVNKIADEKLELKYNKHYIGLSRDGIADNFMTFRARRDYLIAEFRIERSDEVGDRVEASGIDSLPYEERWGRYRLRLTEDDVRKNRELLGDLIRRASGIPAPEEK